MLPVGNLIFIAALLLIWVTMLLAIFSVWNLAAPYLTRMAHEAEWDQLSPGYRHHLIRTSQMAWAAFYLPEWSEE